VDTGVTEATVVTGVLISIWIQLLTKSVFQLCWPKEHRQVVLTGCVSHLIKCEHIPLALRFHDQGIWDLQLTDWSGSEIPLNLCPFLKAIPVGELFLVGLTRIILIIWPLYLSPAKASLCRLSPQQTNFDFENQTLEVGLSNLVFER